MGPGMGPYSGRSFLSAVRTSSDRRPLPCPVLPWEQITSPDEHSVVPGGPDVPVWAKGPPAEIGYGRVVTPQCEQETHGEALPQGDLLLDRDAPSPTGYVFIRGVSVWKEGQTLRRALICLEIETHGKLPSPSGVCLFMAESEMDLTWRDFLQRPEQPRRTVCSWPEVTCCRLWAPCAGLQPVVRTHSEHTGRQRRNPPSPGPRGTSPGTPGTRPPRPWSPRASRRRHGSGSTGLPQALAPRTCPAAGS